MFEFPLISILVPIFNSQEYLQKCLESLFNQTYANLEYVFVDDASQDDSFVLLKQLVSCYPKLESRIKIIHLTSNHGVSNARNVALENASGKYVLFVDSDDCLYNVEAVDCLYDKAFQEDADIVLGGFVYKTQHSSTTYHYGFSLKEEYIRKVILSEYPATVCGKLIKKELLSENLISSIPGINYGEDFVMTIQMALVAQKISHIDQPVYLYVRRSGNSLSHPNEDTIYQCYTKINQELSKSFGKRSCEMNLLKLRTKLLFLKNISDIERLKQCELLYSDILVIPELSFKDRLLLTLSKHHMFRFIVILQKIHMKIQI